MLQRNRYLENTEGQLVRVHILQIFAQLVVQEPGDQSLQHDLRECKTFFLEERFKKKGTDNNSFTYSFFIITLSQPSLESVALYILSAATSPSYFCVNVIIA